MTAKTAEQWVLDGDVWVEFCDALKPGVERPPPLGTLCWRWIGADRQPPVAARVVKFDEL